MSRSSVAEPVSRLGLRRRHRPGYGRRRCGRGFVYLDLDGAPLRDRETIERLRAAGGAAGVDGRVVLHRPRGSHPGDRARRQGPQAVPVSRRMAARPRGGQVRLARRLRPFVADPARSDRRRHAPARPVVRTRRRHHRLVARQHADPDRQRRVLQRLVRPDDAARRTRRRVGRRRSTSGSSASPASQHDVMLSDRRVARIVAKCQDLPGQQLLQYVVDDDAARGRLARRERLHPRSDPLGVHGQDVPDLGRQRLHVGRAAPPRSGRHRARSTRPRSDRRSRTPPSCCATRQRSAVRATSTHGCSKRTSTAACTRPASLAAARTV